jgi:uncharacterized protein
MAKFSIYTDRAGQWRWTLWAENNKKIANSGEGYVRRDSCLDAIRLVKREGPSAPVYDMSGSTQQLVPGV